ncbi:hypothetical protein AB1L42_21550 [Thalassoglobus sp. JC818]|uniref:hypothetical protein n=1 Tax=Thalassoglobus sp. JC818 TaxID=3232136 RepID=UPI003459BF66
MNQRTTGRTGMDSAAHGGEFSVFLFTNGDWFPIVENVALEDAQRTVGQMSTIMDCATQIRNSDETIIIQEGELISTCIV